MTFGKGHYITRAVEFALIDGPQWDSLALELGAAHWEPAVRESGYVAAQRTVRGRVVPLRYAGAAVGNRFPALMAKGWRPRPKGLRAAQ